MSYLKPLIISAALAITGVQASAQCPTSADLAKGIRVENTNTKTRSDYSRASPSEHLVEKRANRTRTNKVVKQTTWLVNGLMPGATTRGGGMTKMVYPRDATSQVKRLPQKNFSIRFQSYFGGRKYEKGHTSYRYEGKGTVKLGSCSYEVWKVRTDTKLADGKRFIWRQYYAPGLDISLRSEKLSPQGRAMYAVTYNKISKLR